MATESRAPVELRTIARYESLIRVSEALRAYHDRETLFRSLARELRPVVAFSFLGLALLDEETQAVEPYVLEASGELAEPPHLSSEEQLTYWVLRDQQPLVIPVVEHETRLAQEMAYLRYQGIRSTCSLPGWASGPRVFVRSIRAMSASRGGSRTTWRSRSRTSSSPTQRGKSPKHSIGAQCAPAQPACAPPTADEALCRWRCVCCEPRGDGLR